VFTQIDIALEASGPVPRFRLSTGNGEAPRVTTLVLTDSSADEPIWWLVPQAFTSVHPFTIGEVDEEAVNSLATMDDLDPLEDLPPSDTRHQRALAEREALEDATLIPLASVTYGQVPPGFRQSHPPAGPPPALVPGREYCLAVMGGSVSGHFSFMR
jgi:hypothetical protein